METDVYQHACSGAECPWCSPWAIVQPEFSYEMNVGVGLPTWRDSTGQRVTQQPKALKPSTTVIILHGTMENREVLCQQRADNQWWCFPGGSQNIGESIMACALRETQEETGLVVHLLGVTSVDSDPDHYALCSYQDGVVHYTNITFLARLSEYVWDEHKPEMRVCSESLQLKWASIHHLPEPFLYNHRWRLERALAHKGPYLPVR